MTLYSAPSSIAKGAVLAYHVPLSERFVDLAACYRPEGIIDDEEFQPHIPPDLHVTKQPFTVTAVYDLLKHRFRSLRHIYSLALTRFTATRRNRCSHFNSRTEVLCYIVRPALYSGS